jgi:hypothetical protein
MTFRKAKEEIAAVSYLSLYSFYLPEPIVIPLG